MKIDYSMISFILLVALVSSFTFIPSFESNHLFLLPQFAILDLDDPFEQ